MNLTICTKYYSFPWSDSQTSWKKYSANIQVWITIVYQLFFQVNIIFHRKVVSSACDSSNHTIAFPRDSHSLLPCSKQALCILAIYLPKIGKTYVCKSRLNKSNHFYPSWREFLGETCFLPFIIYKYFLLIWLFWVFAVAWGMFDLCWGMKELYLWHVNLYLRHVGFSSLTRDQTWAPCTEKVES